MPPRTHRPRPPTPGQLLLFDLIEPFAVMEQLAAPGTTLTPFADSDEAADHEASPWTSPPTAGGLCFPSTVGTLAAPPRQDTAARLPTDGPRIPAETGADDADVPIVSVQRADVPTAPIGQDHVCTPADVVVGAVARFEANLAALALLKSLEHECRPPTLDERVILARFSGFGDSAFEAAFRLSAHRPEDRPWVDRGHRLRSLVSDAEWQSLERSRLNAFFTSPDVITAMWDGLLALGLATLPAPRILEPSGGSGRFLGLQPPESARRSSRTAIELDTLTARLLRLLYPRAAVHALGFEHAPLRDGSFDVAISNVPFGDVPVVDRAFLKPGQRYLTRAVHNYFFVKALTKLRPGGVLAFITSRYTLDAPTARPIRAYLYQQADLVAAVRLPAGTFPDTDVVTDIVVLRKRRVGDAPGDDAWLGTAVQTYSYQPTQSAYARFARPPEEVHADINAYFVAHPEMVLGTGGAASVMYGGGSYTVVMPAGGREAVIGGLQERLRALPAGLLAPADGNAVLTPPPYLADVNHDLKEGAYAMRDDTVWVCRGGRLVDPRLAPAQAVRVRELLAVRDAARSALRAQLDGLAEPAIVQSQSHLNAVYDRFVVRFGPVNAAVNAASMGTDPEAFFLRALERWDTDTQRRHATGRPVSEQSARERLKMPLFHEIVVRQDRPASSARSVRDAHLIVLNERGTLDFGRMAALLGGSTPESVRDSLAADGLIFDDPEEGWQTADAYLSGNVKRKLASAQKAAQAEPRFSRNVEALQAVIPADIPPGQIEVRLGTHWVPARDVNAFLAEVLGAEEPRWSRTGNQFVRYVPQTAEWVFETDPVVPAARNFGDWGTPRAPALSIIHDLLNGRVPKVTDELDDGRRVTNQQETLAAQEKGEALQCKFGEWLWADADRAERLARDYNETFNAVRPREYNGAHLSLPGSNPAFVLRPHQKAAVWRILVEPAVGLFHEVGAGKTTVMAAAVMELRRLGLAKKVLVVVPNDILQQFATEFQRFYPLARLLVPGKDDFTPARRNEFLARIATGDWDAVLVAQSQFTLLPVHPETEAAFLRRELAGYRDALGELAEAAQEQGDRSWRSSEKSVQKAIQRLSARLEGCQRRLEERQRLTQTMTFEDLGIDRLFVDEAHGYKNLPFASKLERVKGLPNPAECQRASDMFLKTQWLLEKGGGIVFATGTPIANTIAESWTMARYLMRERLEELGLQHFDAWAKLFAETVVTLEQTVTGAYRPTARFARFKNVPEWLQLFQIVADIRMGADVPELEQLKPRLVGGQVPGKRIYRTAAATPELLAFMDQLGKRVESLGPPIKGGDNMLKIASDARKAALDMRLVLPGAPEPPDSKLNLVADEIAAVYRQTGADRGVQLVFLDLGTPKAVEVAARDDDGVLVGTETADEVALLTDVYTDLKRKLTARGIPPDVVRFVHEAKTREARFGLFQAANEGRVRVIIGSTQKLGTGANVQKRLAALHHLDAPWRPMDIEQRDGRGLRQGNEVYGPVFDSDGRVVDPGKGIRIVLYVTERSFDGYVWVRHVSPKSRELAYAG